jgi:hypothetical protein
MSDESTTVLGKIDVIKLHAPSATAQVPETASIAGCAHCQLLRRVLPQWASCHTDCCWLETNSVVPTLLEATHYVNL